jgi:hypothetical protein
MLVRNLLEYFHAQPFPEFDYVLLITRRVEVIIASLSEPVIRVPATV